MENTARVLSKKEEVEVDNPKELIDFRKAYRKELFFKRKKSRKLYSTKQKFSDAKKKKPTKGKGKRRNKLQRNLDRIGIYIPPRRDLLQRIIWKENKNAD